MEDESRLRVTGEGEAGQGGASRGDLYIHIKVKKHKMFERRAQDLYAEHLIPFTVAVLGGKTEVITLNGKTTELKIDAGTPSGKILKIKNEGVPFFGAPDHRGDLYIRVQVEVPVKLSKTEREILERLAEERKDPVTIKKGLFS